MMGPMMDYQGTKAILRSMEQARTATVKNLESVHAQVRGQAMIDSRGPARLKYGMVYPGEIIGSKIAGATESARARRAPEVDALLRKIARQDAAIAAFRLKYGINEERV